MPRLPVCSRVDHRGCSRAWLSDSTPLHLLRTCWSGHTATHRTVRRTDPSIAAANAGTTPADVRGFGPGSGTAGPSPPPQNLLPAKYPSRSDRTTADVG